jgi:hypothetical protein
VGNPLDWRPPSATPRARAMWDRSPMERFYDLVGMSDQRADEYTALLFESFSVAELQAAVTNMYDIRPLVREKAMLDEFVIGRLARSLIRAHWHKIHGRLSRPGYILSLLAVSDTAKHAVLGTPEGRRWLNWTCYELDGLLAYYAEPKGYQPLAPPPGANPLKSLPQPALTSGRQA